MDSVLLRLVGAVCALCVLVGCGRSSLIASPGHGRTFSYSETRSDARSRIRLLVESVDLETERPPKKVWWEASQNGLVWHSLGEGNPFSVDASELAEDLGLGLPQGYWSLITIRATAEDEEGELYVETVLIKLAHRF